ncbi:3-hydroxyanthranilate 3,4-dioxygenase [Aureococcus anophagefferens]|nr:3-hydroxyanthranilate 3,4-dioxygenase [Aureococcus anophagefferens]
MALTSPMALLRRAALRLPRLAAPRRGLASVAPLNLQAWLDEHGPTLQPPVANKLLFGGDLKVVGGPNARRDYHLQTGEEFFLQLSGELCLKIVERGRFKDVRVGAGQTFLRVPPASQRSKGKQTVFPRRLPGHVPHSPQRSARSLGLVFERSHAPEEMDGMLWFDEAADLSDGAPADLGAVAYEEYFHCVDLGAQLAPVIGRYGDWRASGAAPVREAAPPVEADADEATAPPEDTDARLAALRDADAAGATVLHRGDEVICEAHVGPGALAPAVAPFEIFLWQLGRAHRDGDAPSPRATAPSSPGRDLRRRLDADALFRGERSKGEGLDDAQAEEEPEDAVPEEPDAAPADVFPAMNRFLGIAAPGVVA